MDARRRFGQKAEELAAAYLEGRGWRILDRNWRFHHKEIDLVAERDGLVAFVEVKARGAARLADPLEAIGPAKRRDLATAALGWIAGRGAGYRAFRFDAVSVTREPDRTSVRHLEDAWRP